MSFNPAARRQRQEDLREFKASLVYKVSSRRARTVIQRNLVLKNQKPYQFKNQNPNHTIQGLFTLRLTLPP